MSEQKMGVFKKIFMVIGIVVVVLVVLLIIIVGVLMVVKPYGVDIAKVIPAVLNEDAVSSYDHPSLTNQQEVILESIGIDPQDVPTEISPAQQKCAVDILGEERATEIVTGGTPTVSEIFKVKPCFE